ncbi:MAG: chaperone protein DnaJ-like protein molecular chaperone DnaJ, partial [Thermoleophilia bacterium]|nr:chaperone protein DnaJ-like protein molecular chaperone DnaJ [Thermoleophilia bacterium]
DRRVMATTPQTHYDVLGITRDADAGEVRTAWKLHVQVWHPDRFTGDMREEAERRAARINEAYTTLRDSSRRAAYDCRLAADDRDAQRTQQAQPRASVKVRPLAPRAASTPVGTPMAVAEAASLGEQLNAVADELVRSARRHPRMVAAAAACFALLVVGGLTLQAGTGPSLPNGTAVAAGAGPSHVSRIAPEDTADLEAIAKQTQADAARQDAELARQMREDEATMQAQDAADAAADAAAARAAAATAAHAKPAAKGATKAAPAPALQPGQHIVRVMPTVPAR